MSDSNHDYDDDHDDHDDHDDDHDDDRDDDGVDDVRNAARGGRRGRRGRSPAPSRRSRKRSSSRRSGRSIAVRKPARPKRGEHFSLKKSAMIEMVPLAGQVWASFLGRPGTPPATGDNLTDHGNASLHRDALARHQQMQHRIVALSELASRALEMVLD